MTSELKRRLEGDPFTLRLLFKAFGLNPGLSNQHDIMGTIFELFPWTSVKLLKEVFEALQLYDLVDLLEVKPRALRPAFPLKEIERSNARNRPMRFYSKAAVLIIDSGTITTQSNTQSGIGAFFKKLNPLSKETRVPMTTLKQLFEVLIRTLNDTERRLHDAWFLENAIGEDDTVNDLRRLRDDLKRMQKPFPSAEAYDSEAEMKLREITEMIMEKKKELAKYREKRKKLSEDKKLAMEKEKKETFEEARKEGAKLKITLDKLREGWYLIIKVVPGSSLFFQLHPQLKLNRKLKRPMVLFQKCHNTFNLRSGVFFFSEKGEKRTPDTLTPQVVCRPLIKTSVNILLSCQSSLPCSRFCLLR